MSGRNCTRYVKVTLICVDLIIFLSGLIMLIGGSVVQSQINSQYLLKNIGGFSTQAGSIICIIFGLFIIFFGIFGLYAAVKDHQRFLLFYSGIMALVFVIQFITGIVGLSVKNDGSYPEKVAEMFKPSFKIEPPFTTDFYQMHFKCCGWNNYNDYKNVTYFVPKSCCRLKNCNVTGIENSTSAEVISKLIYTDGCQTLLVKTVKEVIEGACGILVAMSIFNLISISLSILLARQIKSGYQFS